MDVCGPGSSQPASQSPASSLRLDSPLRPGISARMHGPKAEENGWAGPLVVFSSPRRPLLLRFVAVSGGAGDRDKALIHSADRLIITANYGSLHEFSLPSTVIHGECGGGEKRETSVVGATARQSILHSRAGVTCLAWMGFFSSCHARSICVVVVLVPWWVAWSRVHGSSGPFRCCPSTPLHFRRLRAPLRSAINGNSTEPMGIRRSVGLLAPVDSTSVAPPTTTPA